MRIHKDEAEYSGTPQELAEFFKLVEPEEKTADENETSNFTKSDFEPLEDIISDSQTLRKKLAEDPNYMPYPGVSPSPESEQPLTLERPDASLDTGVELV